MIDWLQFALTAIVVAEIAAVALIAAEIVRRIVVINKREAMHDDPDQ